MLRKLYWNSYYLPSEFLKNSVYISSRLHLKFHQISNWQWNLKCIFFYDYSINLLIFETRVCAYVYARWRLEWFVECGHLLDGQQQTIWRRVLIPRGIHKIRRSPIFLSQFIFHHDWLKIAQRSCCPSVWSKNIYRKLLFKSISSSKKCDFRDLQQATSNT